MSEVVNLERMAKELVRDFMEKVYDDLYLPPTIRLQGDMGNGLFAVAGLMEQLLDKEPLFAKYNKPRFLINQGFSFEDDCYNIDLVVLERMREFRDTKVT